jgi:hypothetical protein
MADYFTLHKKKSFPFGKVMLIASGIAGLAVVAHGCREAVGYTAAAIYHPQEITYPSYELPSVLPQTLDEMVGTTIEMPHGMKLHVTQEGTISLNEMDQYLQKYGVNNGP